MPGHFGKLPRKGGEYFYVPTVGASAPSYPRVRLLCLLRAGVARTALSAAALLFLARIESAAGVRRVRVSTRPPAARVWTQLGKERRASRKGNLRLGVRARRGLLSTRLLLLRFPFSRRVNEQIARGREEILLRDASMASNVSSLRVDWELGFSGDMLRLRTSPVIGY